MKICNRSIHKYFAGSNIHRVTKDSLNGTIARAFDNLAGSAFMTENQLSKARSLLQHLIDNIDVAGHQLSNFDFQFKNLIEKSADKTVLLDWDNARLSTFDLEHCLSLMWLLMWNNQKWRHELIVNAKQRFTLDQHKFRGAVVLNAILLTAYAWRNVDNLRQEIFQQLENVLDDQFFRSVWEA